MGIRFLCPEGHKLHVKAFLAGKRAVCPKCGAKVVVPLESQAPELLAAAQGGESGVMPDLGPIIAATNTSPSVAPESPVPQPQPFVSPAAAPSAVAPDLLGEDPAAMWYMHHPSLGQFGPATVDVFRSWLSEGRVSAESLVWRNGWAEWRSAMSAFPQFFGTAGLAAPAPSAVAASPTAAYPTVSPVAPAPVVVAPVAAAPVYVAPSAPVGMPAGMPMGGYSAPLGTGALPMGQAVAVGSPYAGYSQESTDDTTSRVRRRRRKSNDTMMIVSGILLALILILGVILVVVLNQQGQPVETESPAKPRRRASEAAPAPAKPKAAPAEPTVVPLEEEARSDDAMDRDAAMEFEE